MNQAKPLRIKVDMPLIYMDYHTHSTFSPDSEASQEELVLSALEKGLAEIAITDHEDLDYPPVDYYVGDGLDYDAYSAEIERLRDKYAGRIRIVKGVEAGLQMKSKEKIVRCFADRSFDYVIGSTHIVDFKDLYDGSFFVGKARDEAFMEYFEDVLASVNGFDFYNVYGHLDFIVRYGGFADKTLNYADYRDIIDEILRSLVNKGKGLELNTSGTRYSLKDPHPSLEILKRYRQLGGEIITVGSDAHTAKDVAADFGRAYGLLKSAGFKAVTSFYGGKPAFVDI